MRRLACLVATAVFVLLVGSCTGAGTSTGTAAGTSPPLVVATGLEVPWGLAFLPDGDALVTERETADILRVSGNGRVRRVGTVRGVHAVGEGGLLGIAVSPDFSADRTVYVYYSAARDNRVVALRVKPGGHIDGGEQVVLVSGIPRGAIHNGGRLKFGPDGMLYVSTGETGHGSLAQNRNSLGGKILRVTPSGAPAPGNPFGTAVFSYGHRNVEGLAWDPDGRMFATEFGENRFDEINRIRAGRNYGWPIVEGFAGDARVPRNYTDPLLTWPTSEASPSGLAYADGDLWACALRGQRLWRIPESPEGHLGTPQARYTGRYGRLRSVVVTPDGSALWITTSNRDGRGSPTPGDDKIIEVPLRH